eukprot:9110331-Pyramimonas_sp.AAC.1
MSAATEAELRQQLAEQAAELQAMRELLNRIQDTVDAPEPRVAAAAAEVPSAAAPAPEAAPAEMPLEVGPPVVASPTPVERPSEPDRGEVINIGDSVDSADDAPSTVQGHPEEMQTQLDGVSHFEDAQLPL